MAAGTESINVFTNFVPAREYVVTDLIRTGSNTCADLDDNLALVVHDVHFDTQRLQPLTSAPSWPFRGGGDMEHHVEDCRNSTSAGSG